MTTTGKALLVIIILIIVVAAIWYGTSRAPEGELPPETKEPIKIGLLMPLTGNAAEIGQSNKKASEIAVKEINEKGGVNGRSLKLIIEDSQGCDAEVAVTAMQKLVNIDKVAAVYSGCSNVAISTHSVAEAGKVVHFGCASHPDVRELGDYMFRIVPSDEFAGKVAAEYVADDFNAKKVAVLYCDSDWCFGLKDAFIETFKSGGGEILIEEQIKMGSTDARTELTKIKQANPDLVYFVGYPDETIVVFKQAKELGLDVVFFGGDTWFDESIAEKAGDTSENKFFTTPAKNYTEEFEQKVKGDLALCTVEAYDIMYILANVMKKVGVDSEAVKNELYNLKDYKGASGIVGLDEKGDLMSAVFDIKTYEDGKIVDYKLGVSVE